MEGKMSEEIKCAVCEKENADFTDLFVLVSSTSSSYSTPISYDTERVTTTYYESVKDVKRLGICNACLEEYKRGAIKDIINDAVEVFAFLIIAALIFAFVSNFVWRFIPLVVLIAICIFFCIREYNSKIVKQEWPFKLEELLRKKNRDIQYVPTNAEYYLKKGSTKPDKELFIKKNDLMVRDLGEKIFTLLYEVEGGAGLIEQIFNSQNNKD